MLRKETAFPRCRAMDRRWNRKTVSLVSWDTIVISICIPSGSSIPRGLEKLQENCRTITLGSAQTQRNHVASMPLDRCTDVGHTAPVQAAVLLRLSRLRHPAAWRNGQGIKPVPAVLWRCCQKRGPLKSWAQTAFYPEAISLDAWAVPERLSSWQSSRVSEMAPWRRPDRQVWL